MPDGQELDVRVAGRRRTRDGRWWYECHALLPARSEHAAGSTQPAAADVAISVAAEDITPIPGEDYSAVPTEGAEDGRQWLAVRVRGVHGPRWAVHRRGCWQARGGWQRRRVTARQARELTAGVPPGDLCDVCFPGHGPAHEEPPEPERR